MVVFKCKMCGGKLEFAQGDTVAVCDSCGTRQTLPRLDDERRINLYDRADHFRRNGEFDKAMRIYEQILNEDSTDAEAYWSLVLCRYGIEYVEDPGTHRRVPTVNRLQYTSIFDDADYESALQYADGAQREVYREQAGVINEIQKDILAISQEEEPYDVFICYKETGADGRRTPDSVLANDLYYELTEEGFRVFFARITLEEKLGADYEPYIFAALNSAKVMVVIGTKPEYYNAAWVRNEWSRYLTLIREGAKKMLIPAYRDMDPYDLPEEFSHLQAQDMSKLGFMQDLVRGIRKIVTDGEVETTVRKRAVEADGSGASVESLLKRVAIFLEDGDWEDADDYCERVLDRDPECARAYLGKLMAELGVHKQEALADCAESFEDNKNYKKVARFGDEGLKAELARDIAQINNRNEAARMEEAYAKAISDMKQARNVKDYLVAYAEFDALGAYRDAPEWKKSCQEKADWCSNQEVYREAITALEKARKADCLIADYEAAIQKFQLISGWADADGQISFCQRRIEEIRAEQERRRMEEQYRKEQSRLEAEQKEKQRKRMYKILFIAACAVAGIVALCIIAGSMWNAATASMRQYREAESLYRDGNYVQAAEMFRELGDYRDSREQMESCYRSFYGEELYDQVSQINPGDIYRFGDYYGSTEWIVLERRGARILLISRYCLEYDAYHYSTNATWQTCYLRRWLNQTFFEEAFSSEEQAKILEANIVTPENKTYHTSGGSDTVDKIFLLCISEVEQYFDSVWGRQTTYDSHLEADLGREAEDYASWWLRTPGEKRTKAAYVRSDGSVSDSGYTIREKAGIRPAIWVDLSIQ